MCFWPANDMPLLPCGLLSLMQEYSFDVGVLPWAQSRSGNAAASWTFPYIELACFHPVCTLNSNHPEDGPCQHSCPYRSDMTDRRGRLQMTLVSYIFSNVIRSEDDSHITTVVWWWTETICCTQLQHTQQHVDSKKINTAIMFVRGLILAVSERTPG